MYSILSLGFFTGHFRFNFFAKEKKQSIDMLLCFSNITVFGKVGTWMDLNLLSTYEEPTGLTTRPWGRGQESWVLKSPASSSDVQSSSCSGHEAPRKQDQWSPHRVQSNLGTSTLQASV